MRNIFEILPYGRVVIPLTILGAFFPLTGSFVPNPLSYPLQAATWQIFDPKAAYHLSLHLVALILGAYLTVISAMAFLRDGRTRVLLLATAFVLIAIREAVQAADLIFFLGQQVMPFTDIEVAHLIDLIIALFSVGTLKS
ncbi:MAG: hypothetical protein FJ358_05145 [Thaumarchaeota archaeon]|nr:hypothetical protein [Nitrososphaerota archaeon]